MQLKTDIGLQVDYDGIYNAYVIVYARYMDKTRGLCGTFNNDKYDDLKKRDGQLTTNTQEFATSWKVNKECHDSRRPPKNPCNTIAKQQDASETCDRGLKVSPFNVCQLANIGDYIQDCKYDVCACKSKRSAICFCEAFDAYAFECSRKGKTIDWISRRQFSHCCKFEPFKLFACMWLHGKMEK